MAIFGRSKDKDEADIQKPAAPPEEGQAPQQPPAPKRAVLPILPLRGVVVYPMMWLPLTVGQERSIRLIDEALTQSEQRVIGLVTSRRPEIDEPQPDQIYEVGTMAMVHRMLRAPDGTIRLIVQGLERIRIEKYVRTQPYLQAQVVEIPDILENTVELEALARTAQEQFRQLINLVPHLPEELEMAALNVEDARQLVYLIASSLRLNIEDAQAILEIDSVTEKLRKLTALLAKELEVLELGRKIQSEAVGEMEKMQREFYLREQMKAIQKELGEGDEQEAEIKELEARIAAAGMPEEAEKEARRELDRMRKMPIQAAEYSVIKTYLDWMVTLPWQKRTEDNLDIAHARQVLDEDHYDLDDIKERILEYLAVRKLKLERKGEAPEDESPADKIRREREGVILCFVGPPGVGKTSLGLSIARAMGRKFVRLALGGIRDEAEIRGFRRTYIGSMPGRIIQSLRRVESRNPVFMLDEVDKLGRDFRGDPSSALLEVLDPEQNREFRDHYLDVPFDLSEVMFITTANMLDTIPEPLLDRMEVIELHSYTTEEKVKIAQGYLVPRQIKENGLRPGEVVFEEEALRRIVRDYTREAGVRNLERTIGTICRKVATKVAENGTGGPYVITADNLVDYLKKPKYFDEVAERTELPGVATGLAWTMSGGDILFLEATRMPGKKGFIVTGQLGDVMKESAQAALSWVRANAQRWGIDPNFFEDADIHLHIPAGAVPKDGPSAGVAMATALVSLLTGRTVKSNVGMTGEITLRGKVLPVGGIKEKVLAAHRAGLDTVILPKRNEKDLDDVPPKTREEMNFVLVEYMDEVLHAALNPPKPSPDGHGEAAQEEPAAVVA
ncbi:MAG: endopeptidase La [Caldilineales bacterium]|nr:endopeptidase La [Caldilineales bacterium]MDW8318644.1 endopeptidase La [Anaerolineae bacterium]